MIDFAEYKAVYRYNINGNVATRYYVGTLEFVKEATDTVPRLVRANLPWGYLDADGRAYAYITDYQGNIRAVVDSLGTAVQTTDYYPYGLPMATSTGTAANRYKYGAKEFETRNGLNFHDFEARMLFNDHTLFGRPDDFAGKYPHLNPYLYCAANPLRYVDPTGEVLELCGSIDDLNDVIEVYQRAIGDVGTVSLNKNNQVQIKINEGTDLSSNIAAKTLSEIINDTNTTMINVENGSMVIIGDVNTGTIDIGDIKALGTDPPANDIGALFHETYEQYLLQSKNYLAGRAHEKALRKEGQIVGAIVNLGLDRNINFENGIIDFKHLVGSDTVFIDILFNSLNNNITTKRKRQ